MKFIEKLKTFATGKTDIEKKQESAAMKEIRKDVIAERLRTRREEAIRFAAESEKIKYANRLKQLKQPKASMSSGMNFNFGNMLGQPRQLSKTKSVSKRKIRRVPQKRKTTNYVVVGGIAYPSANQGLVKRRKVRKISKRIQTPKRFDVLTGSWR